MEKSPQPGHHVGWSAETSFFVRGLRSAGGSGAVRMVDSLINNLKSKFADGGGDVGFGAFQNFAHTPGQAVGFGQAADFWVAITGAQQTAKLAVTVEAFVVHFDDDDMIKTGENIFQPRRQWADMADMHAGHAVP